MADLLLLNGFKGSASAELLVYSKNFWSPVTCFPCINFSLQYAGLASYLLETCTTYNIYMMLYDYLLGSAS